MTRVQTVIELMSTQCSSKNTLPPKEMVWNDTRLTWIPCGPATPTGPCLPVSPCVLKYNSTVICTSQILLALLIGNRTEWKYYVVCIKMNNFNLLGKLKKHEMNRGERKAKVKGNPTVDPFSPGFPSAPSFPGPPCNKTKNQFADIK